MKMIYAIIRDEDGDKVMEALNKEKYSVTKLASTGSFLRTGNTTLIIGTDEQSVDKAIEIIKTQCGKRRKVTYAPSPSLEIGAYPMFPVTIDVGGATIFVIDVERFEKI